MKLFAFAASLRKESLNKKLIVAAVEAARKAGAEVELVDFAELVCPNYNQDDKDANGFPEGAERFKALLEANDGVLIASPEYNYAVPGVLKNALDWVSRYRPTPTKGKHAYLLSTSPGMVGGNRGLWSLRQPLEVMGTHVYPSMFSQAQGTKNIGDGALTDEAQQGRLEAQIADFVAFAGAAKSGGSASF